MQRVTAKICGLSTPETLGAAVRHGASHVGFVFFPKSPRNVHPDQARALIELLPRHICPVGVFVDPDDDLIRRTVAAGIDIIQLHGKETPERAHAIKASHQVQVWKAIAVRTANDMAKDETFVGGADGLLYDAKPPPSADLPGGTGLRFDWSLLGSRRRPPPLPWALSGGIDVNNVADAVNTTGARLIDVSSGVESAPGIKDVDKIAAFLQRIAQL